MWDVFNFVNSHNSSGHNANFVSFASDFVSFFYLFFNSIFSCTQVEGIACTSFVAH